MLFLLLVVFVIFMLFSCLGSDYCATHPNVSLLDIFLAIMGILLLLFVVLILLK